jgi:two-component system, LytTR family, sensor kinase
MREWVLAGLAAAAAILVTLVTARLLGGRNELAHPADVATHRTLHTASLAAPALSTGLNADSAARAIKHLRWLLGADALAITDTTRTLAWDGTGDEGASAAIEHARTVIREDKSEVLGTQRLTGANPVLRHAVAAPLRTDGGVVGALVAYGRTRPSAITIRATEEVATFVSGQLDLAELDRTRARTAEAEVLALRAQISPHFVYNSLTAIASFVRTDPDRARELLLEFAEFTRYSFRRHGEFTTLADELRSIEQYLLLEKARFGDRLGVTLRVAPEVLGVTIPFLCIQPLVENAVRHGLEGRPGPGHVAIRAEDVGADCLISIEDDGAGIDPERVRRTLAGEPGGDHVGLANVDERLRSAFGDTYGVVVETAPGAGTKVTLRIPKFAVGVTPT